MAHEKVYGFDESKCRVEVPPKNELVDLIYPVGSIYMSVNNIDPSDLFGGTWERWAHGQVIVGVNEGDSTFNGANKVGGEKAHKLTVEEMPSHTHSQNPHSHGGYIWINDGGSHSHMLGNGTVPFAHSSTWEGDSYSEISGSGYKTARLGDSSESVSSIDRTQSAGTHNHTGGIAIQNTTSTNNYTGGNYTHNNLQPYITAYIWKRTA